MGLKFLKKSFCILLLLFSFFSIRVVGEAPRPNILFILMDDLGYADVGFMPGAASDVFTPNIDALANEGTVFTSAYVTHCFCGPSRASILTGRMPHDIGAQYNLAAFSGNGIDASEKFISDILSEANYNTGVIGKWHLGEESQYHPNSRGFDYFFGFLGGGHEYFSRTWINANTYNPSNYNVGNYGGSYNSPIMEDDKYISFDKDQYCTDVLTDAGIDFINKAPQNSDPFFLFMSYNAPHTPLQAKDEDVAAIQAKLGDKAASENDRLTYTAMMYNADYNIKRIVDKLKETGMYDNTLIVFLSDNGGRPDQGANNSPLRGRKGDVYEGGFRVPMFFHWPNGGVPQGEVNPNTFSSLDFYPTFAHLAGASIPQSKIYDGINVWDHVVNNTNPRKDSTIFIMRQHNGNNFTGVVKNNFKLYTLGNGSWQLYNLTTDISESKDISNQHQDVVTSMKRAAYKWTWGHKERPDFFDNPSYGFEKKWDDTNMPNFGRTFGTIYDPEDYVTTISTQLYNPVLVHIFPNPTKSKLNIAFGSDINSNIDVLLYDIQGKVVQREDELKQNGSNVYTLNIDPELSNGTYMLKTSYRGNVVVKPIVLSY